MDTGLAVVFRFCCLSKQNKTTSFKTTGFDDFTTLDMDILVHCPPPTTLCIDASLRLLVSATFALLAFYYNKQPLTLRTTTHPPLFLERADNTRGPRWCAALYRRTNLLSVVPPSQHARRCTAVRRTRRTCQALYRRAEMPTVVPASRCASDQGARPIRPKVLLLGE